MIIDIFVMNILLEDIDYSLTKISHHLQVLWISHFKGWMGLDNNQLTGTLLSELGNMAQLSNLLCAHCLNSLIDFAFYITICIYLL